MKNNRTGIFIVVSVLVLSSLACSLSGLIPGVGGTSSGAGTVTDLWPDVPKMDGITILQQDIPLEIRLVVQTFFAAASGNQGSINFIAYSTDKTPADVVAYYSTDRMKSAGWDSTNQTGCISDTSSSTPTSSQGGMCLFGKTAKDNTGTLLAIVPSVDSTTKKTDIFFARIELKDITTPTPTP
jgi:hypothetical protein